MDSFRLFTKKSHFLICQDKMKHSELLTGVGLTEHPPHHSVRAVWHQLGSSAVPAEESMTGVGFTLIWYFKKELL